MKVEAILKELQALQSHGRSVYPHGIVSSQRYHPFLPYEREDDNLFFTASIVHILQELRSKLSTEELVLADEIISSGTNVYDLFKNKDGLDTYNFWQTKPSRHFPDGLLMHRFKHFQIPDDVDDTALVYLTENASKERVEKLREKLQLHANLAYKKAFNPLSKYRNRKIYSTFFGKKMYIEFDVCVLSNLMRAILPHFSEDLNEYDENTVDFICEVIENDEHKTHPFYSAPNYPTTELILYHVSRLIPTLPNKYKDRIEKKVVDDLKDIYLKDSGMNSVLIENALLKLGEKITVSINEYEIAVSDEEFFFFHAGMITAFENSLAQKLAKHSLFHLRYRCEALNRALLLENQVLGRSLT